MARGRKKVFGEYEKDGVKMTGPKAFAGKSGKLSLCVSCQKVTGGCTKMMPAIKGLDLIVAGCDVFAVKPEAPKVVKPPKVKKVTAEVPVVNV